MIIEAAIQFGGRVYTGRAHGDIISRLPHGIDIDDRTFLETRSKRGSRMAKIDYRPVSLQRIMQGRDFGAVLQDICDEKWGRTSNLSVPYEPLSNHGE